MVECGSMSDPPNRQHMTVWAYLEIAFFVIYGVIAIVSVALFIKSFNKDKPISHIIQFVSNIFVIIAFVFTIWGFCKDDRARLKYGLYSFLTGFVFDLAVFILGLVFGFNAIFILSIAKAALGAFLCYMLYLQQKKLG